MNKKYDIYSLFNSLTDTWIKRTIIDMKYTFKQFKAEYPDDNACLQAVFDNRFGDLKFCPKCGAEAKFYRLKGRPVYSCQHCRYQLSPLANTIFRKSSTSLWNWFYAIYQFSNSKNGVSAKKLERDLGVTYKTAWRMAKQIRLLMQEETGQFMGVVEADETYIGGRRKITNYHDNKTPIIALAEKRGAIKAKSLDTKATSLTVMPWVKENLLPLSVLHTDKSHIYLKAKETYKHRSVDHGVGTYVKNGVHTNTLEGFFSQLKRSIDGTYHVVSPKYLNGYLAEFVYRYNHRYEPICPLLLARV